MALQGLLHHAGDVREAQLALQEALHRYLVRGAQHRRRGAPGPPGREGQAKPGLSLTPGQLWWQHTAGAARALGLEGVIGNLLPGHEADFVVLNPEATPLLARKTAQANSLDELLFALIVLGDDRVVERTVVNGR